MKQFTFKKNYALTTLTMFLFVLAFALPNLLIAQGDDMDMAFWDKVKADKKQVVADNMGLTDAEATGFWPIYEGFQQELKTLNERLKTTIATYADGYTNNTLTDETAKKLIDETIAIEKDEAKMRQNYAKKLAKVLPGKKVARYIQIENKIRALVRFELAAGIPLVE